MLSLNNGFITLTVLVFLLPLVSTAASNELPTAKHFALPAMYGNGMVLQRNQPIQISGTADPDSRLTVSLGVESQNVRSDHAGVWATHLASLPAGGPYSLKITGAEGHSLEFTDILCGDVWLWAGEKKESAASANKR